MTTRTPSRSIPLPSTLALFAAVFSQALPAAAQSRPAEPVLGYINHIPPEPAEARRARHDQIARRRADLPILVHRGAWDAAPENTLEAYAAAMDFGADGCEIDIRRTKDGVLYLHHDDNLGRTLQGSGRIRDLTYYEILSTPMKLYGSADRHTRVPTLAAFLALARRRAMLIHLDVKEPGLQDDIARLFDEADMWDHIVEVNDYNADRLRFSPKVKRMQYKGWFPQGEHSDDADAIRDFLARPGNMIFADDPRPAVRALGRKPRKPQPLPKLLRAPWTPAGVARAQPATAPASSPSGGL